MNKKLFIGATVITATVVGTAIYYRHRLLQGLKDVTVWFDDPSDDEEVQQAFLALQEDMEPSPSPKEEEPRET